MVITHEIDNFKKSLIFNERNKFLDHAIDDDFDWDRPEDQFRNELDMNKSNLATPNCEINRVDNLLTSTSIKRVFDKDVTLYNLSQEFVKTDKSKQTSPEFVRNDDIQINDESMINTVNKKDKSISEDENIKIMNLQIQSIISK